MFLRVAASGTSGAGPAPNSSLSLETRRLTRSTDIDVGTVSSARGRRNRAQRDVLRDGSTLCAYSRGKRIDNGRTGDVVMTSAHRCITYLAPNAKAIDGLERLVSVDRTRAVHNPAPVSSAVLRSSAATAP